MREKITHTIRVNTQASSNLLKTKFYINLQKKEIMLTWQAL